MKNTGSYYTPQIISDFMVRNILSGFEGQKTLQILEPSSGEGAFINSLVSYYMRNRNNSPIVDAIDINNEALKHCQKELGKIGGQCPINLNLYHKDFLDHALTSNKRYDIVIGNPPYISRIHIPEDQKEKALLIHSSLKLQTKSIQNMWTAFVLGASNLLKDTGVLALVLPTEILQVKYAEEIRTFLIKSFARIEIVTAKKLLFKSIEQDVIILIAYKDADKLGLFFSEVKTIDELKFDKVPLIKNEHLNNHKSKWTNHILSKFEMDFMSDVASHLQSVRSYCNSVAGIVTAANNYFILTDEQIKEYGLTPVSRPIIQKAGYVNGGVVFSDNDFDSILSSGKPCQLLCFEKASLSTANYDKYFDYFNKGIEQKIWSRHKCQKRSHWLVVPTVWESEGFFFKRCHEYPKLLRNDSKALVTDAGYRVSPLTGYSMEGLISSFYNSFTLAFAEMTGRYYGGGVLELTPNEFKMLPLPYVEVNSEEFDCFAQRFQDKKDINDILRQQDQYILKGKLGLTDGEVHDIQNIKVKLSGRRLRS